jgi:AcrR family transcriptional regulator
MRRHREETRLSLATDRRDSATVIPRGETTRKLILDAAEQLFAKHGINGVSLRTIVARAGVNTAAIHYHFGSKDGLVEAVFARRAVPIAEERLKLLAACRTAPDRPPLLEQIIHAFVEPTMRGRHIKEYARLRASMVADSSPFISSLFGKYFDVSTGRFLVAVAAALPALPEKDIYWRFHAMLGAMVYPLANPGRINRLTAGAFDPSNVDEALGQLVPLLAHMFRAPPSAAFHPAAVKQGTN